MGQDDSQRMVPDGKSRIDRIFPEGGKNRKDPPFSTQLSVAPGVSKAQEPHGAANGLDARCRIGVAGEAAVRFRTPGAGLLKLQRANQAHWPPGSWPVVHSISLASRQMKGGRRDCGCAGVLVREVNLMLTGGRVPRFI